MRQGGRSEEQLASCCLQILISEERHPLSGIFHFPEVSLTPVTNQEAWTWPMKAAMAPKDVSVCSQLKLVQAETSRRDAGNSRHNKSGHSPGLGGSVGCGESQGVPPLALQSLSVVREQIPRMRLSQHLSRELPLHIRPQPTPRAVSSPLAWQPNLAPRLAMASQCPKDFCLIPSGRLAWKLAGCKPFCSKAWDFSFPAKWLGFSARLGEVLIAPACGRTANGS